MLWTRVALSVLTSVLLTLSAVSATEYASLKETHALLLNYLDRVQNGKQPCYTRPCQLEKRRLLQKIQNKLEVLPSLEGRLLPNRRLALSSAYRLVDEPFIYPSSNLDSPQNITEWLEWWKRRYAYESRLHSNWTAFYSAVVSHERALQLISSLKKSPRQKLQLKHWWKRGLGEAARSLRQAVQAFQESSRLAMQGAIEESEAHREESESFFKRVEEFEEAAQIPFRMIVKDIFPDHSLVEATSFLVHYKSWIDFFEPNDILEQHFFDYLNYQKDSIQEISNLIQDFRDLEYGVVGLNNFDSISNPAKSVRHELDIQKRLDVLDESLRAAIELSFFFSFLNFSEAVLGSYRLGILGVSGWSLAAERNNFELSEIYWERSERSTELLQQLPQLEAQMEYRKQELLQTEEALENKIQEIESRLQQSQKGDKT